MPTYTIYGYNEHTPYAGISSVHATDLPGACERAATFFPAGCVTNAIPFRFSSMALPTAWYESRTRMLEGSGWDNEAITSDLASRRERDDDDREPRRAIHCDYSDVSALEYGPRG